jgi:hypothetical protein
MLGSVRACSVRVRHEATVARVVVAAALLHVTIAILLFAAARAPVAPRLIDGGDIIRAVAVDGIGYRADAAELAATLRKHASPRG